MQIKTNSKEIEEYLGDRMEIHHIGIVVKDIYKSIDIYNKLGYSVESEICNDQIQNNRIVFMKSEDGRLRIELIEPMNKASSISNFPEGYHHICYDVSNDEDFLKHFHKLKIGKIFTKPIIAPAIDSKKVVFAFLRNNSFAEFIL